MSGGKVSFRIRREYFDQIVEGSKKEELRSYTPFWYKRLILGEPNIAVFVCGKRVHRRYIKNIYIDIPKKVLGRLLSSQGIKDIPTESCIVVELGEVVK